MDLTNVFVDMFAGKNFSSMEEFILTQETFSKETGSQFQLYKSNRHKGGTARAELIVYARCEFRCTAWRSTSCDAFFVLGCKGYNLYVSKFNMLHNHIVDPALTIKRIYPAEKPYKIQADFTSEFYNIFTKKLMKDFVEFFSKLEEFQKLTGSMYSVRGTKRWPENAKNNDGLNYKFVWMTCVHYGHYEPRRTKRATHSNRIGCKSTVRAAVCPGGVHITKAFFQHNHPVSVETSTRYYQNRRLHGPARLEAAHLIGEGISINDLWVHLRDKYNPSLTKEDVCCMKRIILKYPFLYKHDINEDSGEEESFPSGDYTEIESSSELKEEPSKLSLVATSNNKLNLLSSISLLPMSSNERLAMITPELQNLGDFALACSTEKVLKLKSLLQEVYRKVSDISEAAISDTHVNNIYTKQSL